jgi:predicted NUDIX family phosphoesterase
VVENEIEQVWGIPRQAMEDQIGRFQGFLPVAGDLNDCCSLLEPFGSFRPRNEVEEDPQWKQVIPYIALRYQDRILTLRRLSTQGEARLHNKLSIGVGGHVNPESPGPDPLLVRGMRRELREEIDLQQDPVGFRMIGWINDDQTEVGQVHLGLAVLAEMDHMPSIRETDRMEGQWRIFGDLELADESWESWSAYLIPALNSGHEFSRETLSG